MVLDNSEMIIRRSMRRSLRRVQRRVASAEESQLETVKLHDNEVADRIKVGRKIGTGRYL